MDILITDDEILNWGSLYGYELGKICFSFKERLCIQQFLFLKFNIVKEMEKSKSKISI